MELFRKAKTIRLRTHKDKYLIAEDDKESVCQDRDGSTENAIWTVESVPGRDAVRFKSCYGTYLTASSIQFLPGVTGKRVIQTVPNKFDPATEWEPWRDGMEVRLRTWWGTFLRPNGGLPPWRNSITHDKPHRSKTYDKVLWDVDMVEMRPVHECKQPTARLTFCRSKSLSSSFVSRRKRGIAALKQLV